MFNGSLCPLPKHLQNLLFQVNDSKVKKSNNIDNKYLKVVIVPIIFFTDDTSGGSSKQHIPYESWSMTYAALPLEERGRRENTMFIGCAPKSDGINAMHFIPAQVADMKALEKGIAMFSGEHNETVLVKAPVMFISADNPAHSDIYAASDCSRKNAQIVDALEAGALNAYDLGFKNTGSQDLLLLNSFDPSQDTPVEALHCLPLGVAKYLIEHLVKITLGGRANEDKMNRLISRLKENECNPSYTKNFRRQLRHVGSFVGRDFKQLIQVLPGIIASEFTDPVNDIKVIQLNRPLQALGKLCSLLFVRQIEAGFEDYVNSIEVSIKELTASLYEFDTITHNKNASKSCFY
ncbi:hypothetical protein G6F25_011963 [Rhizopus arrhizus]|nr:hypothetical protein G6F25_011963 [Rhizopus arrhizus]